MTRRVLYVVSRFPKVTETFVVNEWSALADRFDMYLAALVHTDEVPLHDSTRRALNRAWFVPPLALPTFAAHGRWLARSPRRYLAVAATVLRAGLVTTPREFLKTLVAFHQAVRLAVLVTDTHIDHVHAHFANHPATAAWVVHRLTGVPFSFTAHANDLFRTPALLANTAGEAQFVVAISDYNRRMLLHTCPGATVHVVHCGVDTTEFVASRPGPRTSSGHVCCVAGFEPKKGHRDLLQAFARLVVRRNDLDLRLTLIGDGPERAAIELLAQTLRVADRVVFRGACSSHEVRDQLRATDVFVLPAVRDETGRMDGIPVALMEAMSAGVPVVTTAISGIPELVNDDCGIVVAPGNPDAVERAIERILDDDALANHLAANGRARVEQAFDLYVEAAKLGALFDASAERRT